MSATTVLTPLSVALREGTRDEHQTAERSGFVELLLSGRLDRRRVRRPRRPAAGGLHRAGGGRRASCDDDGGLVFDELTRCPPSSRTSPTCTARTGGPRCAILPATQVYADRLAQTADSLPRYAAHAYTRYLGDLSGGQIIKRMLERHYGFTSEGIAFYDFPEIHKLKPFKDVYRERLDALPLDDEARAAVVEEARLAFRLNADVFGELGATHVR